MPTSDPRQIVGTQSRPGPDSVKAMLTEAFKVCDDIRKRRDKLMAELNQLNETERIARRLIAQLTRKRKP